MRIGSNLFGVDLMAQHSLARASKKVDQSSMRLSTMLQINRGSDNPAGLIAVETLRAELTAIKAATDNAARAGGIIAVADSGMSQVTSLLNDVRANVIAAAGGGLSDAEIAAKQMEIDAAMEAISRIGRTTSFGSMKLLDGSADALTFSFSPNVNDTATLSLPAVSAHALGGSAGRLSDLTSGGSASLDSGNLGKAMDILDGARDQVIEAQARAGAFQKYTIDSSMALLGSMEVNLSSAKSAIGDTDVAAESSKLIQAQILVNSAISAVVTGGQNRGLIGGLLGL